MFLRLIVVVLCISSALSAPQIFVPIQTARSSDWPEALTWSYYSPFLTKLNPTYWIEEEARRSVDEKLEYFDSRQKAVFNVVKCLTLEDFQNCTTLLNIAENLFKVESKKKKQKMGMKKDEKQ